MRKVGLFLAAICTLLLAIIVGGSVDLEASGGGEGLTGVSAEYEKHVLRAGSICPEITPALIAAQIEAESNWNPAATSPVGAAGISQFMPATWASVGRDGDGDGIADVRNPADAIFSQGHYMCGQVREVKRRIAAGVIKGDVVALALAAYNAGLGNVEAYGGVPPFAETRAYIPKILGLAKKYVATGVSGGPVGRSGLVYPLPQRFPITSPFGWRWHPVRGGNVHHDGTDYGAPCGTPIMSVKAGTVVFAGWWGSGGHSVEIDHGGGFKSHYLHMTNYVVGQGQTVKQGQLIGYVGTTGGSTGCHLHLGFMQDGNYIDPDKYLQ